MGSDYDPANHSDSLSDGSVSSIDPTSPDSVLSAFDDNFPNVRQATNRDSSASEVSTSANEPLERDSEATVRRPASSAVEMEMSSVVTNGMRLAARPLKDEAGQEILEFARWASSLDGLPNLQVIAWGNFSYEGRYAKDSVLLCRDQTKFRPLTIADTFIWDLIDNNIDMLAACRQQTIVL